MGNENQGDHQLTLVKLEKMVLKQCVYGKEYSCACVNHTLSALEPIMRHCHLLLSKRVSYCLTE